MDSTDGGCMRFIAAITRLDSSQDSWRTPLLSLMLSATALFSSLGLAAALIWTPLQFLSPRGLIPAALLILMWTAAIFKQIPEAFRLATLLAGYIAIAALNILSVGPVDFAILFPSMLLLLMAMLYGG